MPRHYLAQGIYSSQTMDFVPSGMRISIVTFLSANFHHGTSSSSFFVKVFICVVRTRIQNESQNTKNIQPRPN